MVVGKALFEGTLLKANFASFFLNKFVDKGNSIDELKTLDAGLYNNLMYLKYYDGKVEDLGLFMAVSESVFGHTYQIPLVPGGESIPVTNENKLDYIMRYANYSLNTKT